MKARELGSAQAIVLAVDNSDSMSGARCATPSGRRRVPRRASRRGRRGLVAFGHEALALTPPSAREVRRRRALDAPRHGRRSRNGALRRRRAVGRTPPGDVERQPASSCCSPTGATRLAEHARRGDRRGAARERRRLRDRGGCRCRPRSRWRRSPRRPAAGSSTPPTRPASARYRDAQPRARPHVAALLPFARSPGRPATLTVRAGGAASATRSRSRAGTVTRVYPGLGRAEPVHGAAVVVLWPRCCSPAAGVAGTPPAPRSEIGRCSSPTSRRTSPRRRPAGPSPLRVAVRLDGALARRPSRIGAPVRRRSSARASTCASATCRTSRSPRPSSSASSARSLGAPPALALLLMLVGLAAPFVALQIAARRRTKAFDRQLPDVLATIASTLRAGHGLRPALRRDRRRRRAACLRGVRARARRGAARAAARPGHRRHVRADRLARLRVRRDGRSTSSRRPAARSPVSSTRCPRPSASGSGTRARSRR